MIFGHRLFVMPTIMNDAAFSEYNVAFSECHVDVLWGGPDTLFLKFMNDRQRTILGVAAMALIVIILFFVPWRVESTDEIKWAPAYRPPISTVRSYSTELHGTSLAYNDGEIAVSILVLQILAIGIVAGGALIASGDDSEK